MRPSLLPLLGFYLRCGTPVAVFCVAFMGIAQAALHLHPGLVSLGEGRGALSMVVLVVAAVAVPATIAARDERERLLSLPVSPRTALVARASAAVILMTGLFTAALLIPGLVESLDGVSTWGFIGNGIYWGFSWGNLFDSDFAAAVGPLTLAMSSSALLLLVLTGASTASHWWSRSTFAGLGLLTGWLSLSWFGGTAAAWPEVVISPVVLGSGSVVLLWIVTMAFGRSVLTGSGGLSRHAVVGLALLVPAFLYWTNLSFFHVMGPTRSEGRYSGTKGTECYLATQSILFPRLTVYSIADYDRGVTRQIGVLQDRDAGHELRPASPSRAVKISVGGDADSILDADGAVVVQFPEGAWLSWLDSWATFELEDGPPARVRLTPVGDEGKAVTFEVPNWVARRLGYTGVRRTGPAVYRLDAASSPWWTDDYVVLMDSEPAWATFIESGDLDANRFHFCPNGYGTQVGNQLVVSQFDGTRMATLDFSGRLVGGVVFDDLRLAVRSRMERRMDSWKIDLFSLGQAGEVSLIRSWDHSGPGRSNLSDRKATSYVALPDGSVAPTLYPEQIVVQGDPNEAAIHRMASFGEPDRLAVLRKDGSFQVFDVEAENRQIMTRLPLTVGDNSFRWLGPNRLRVTDGSWDTEAVAVFDLTTEQWTVYDLTEEEIEWTW